MCGWGPGQKSRKWQYEVWKSHYRRSLLLGAARLPVSGCATLTINRSKSRWCNRPSDVFVLSAPHTRYFPSLSDLSCAILLLHMLRQGMGQIFHRGFYRFGVDFFLLRKSLLWYSPAVIAPMSKDFSWQRCWYARPEAPSIITKHSTLNESQRGALLQVVWGSMQLERKPAKT